MTRIAASTAAPLPAASPANTAWSTGRDRAANTPRDNTHITGTLKAAAAAVRPPPEKPVTRNVSRAVNTAPLSAAKASDRQARPSSAPRSTSTSKVTPSSSAPYSAIFCDKRLESRQRLTPFWPPALPPSAVTETRAVFSPLSREMTSGTRSCSMTRATVSSRTAAPLGSGINAPRNSSRFRYRPSTATVVSTPPAVSTPAGQRPSSRARLIATSEGESPRLAQRLLSSAMMISATPFPAISTPAAPGRASSAGFTVRSRKRESAAPPPAPDPAFIRAAAVQTGAVCPSSLKISGRWAEAGSRS